MVLAGMDTSTRHDLHQLNSIRLDEDLTYEQLADLVGIHASALHRLLNQPDRRIHDRTLHKVRRFLAARSGKKRGGRARAAA